MRLYRRYSEGPWWADFWQGGRRVRRSTGTTDKEAAQEWADRLKAGLWRLDRLGERPPVTWDEAVLDWLAANMDLRALSDRKDQLRWASKHLGGKPLSSIDRRTLESLATKKSGEGVKPATVNRHLAAISAVLRRAHAQGYVDTLPPIPRRREPQKRVAWATEEQAVKLIDALPAPWAAMAEFSLATGLRRGNVTALRWSAVDLRQRIAWVHADEAKAGKVLAVPLSPAAIALLLRQKGKHKLLVFPGRTGEVHAVPDEAWKKACKKAGLKAFRWHDLRHTWASWHVQRGTQLQTLQELGGWKTYAMVLRYAHLAPSHVAQFAGNSGLNRTPKEAQSDAPPEGLDQLAS